MAYTPENSALPSGHLEGLRLTTKWRQFEDEFAAFRRNWDTQFRAWLAAHDTGSVVIQTSDGQFVPITEVEFTPYGRIIHIGNVQTDGGEGGEGGE